MSLQLRLIVVMASLLVTFLAALVTLLLVQAAPRVVAETESAASFAEAFARRSLLTVRDAPAGEAEVQRLLIELHGVRHVRVRFVAGTRVPPPIETVDPLDWLVRRIPGIAAADRSLLPVVLRGSQVGFIEVVGKPSDELRELLGEIWQITLAGFAISLALFGLTSWVITTSLLPLGSLRTALVGMQNGEYGVDLPEAGPPELRSVARGVNNLARALREAQAENVRLSNKLVRLQDQERAEIARELHDELGPHLFAARTRGTSIRSELAKAEPDIGKTATSIEALLEQINEIQATNRRVLQKLEPAGLKELGLLASIAGLIDRWRREQPHVDLSLDLPPTLPLLDDTLNLTVFRVVQEGLTNAFRHAGAESIRVSLSVEPVDGGRVQRLRVEIEDTGCGIEGAPQGFGLSAMRQRILALGGTLNIESRPGRGVCLHVLLDCHC